MAAVELSHSPRSARGDPGRVLIALFGGLGQGVGQRVLLLGAFIEGGGRDCRRDGREVRAGIGCSVFGEHRFGAVEVAMVALGALL